MNTKSAIQIINHTHANVTWRESKGVTHIFIGSAAEVEAQRTSIAEVFKYSAVSMLVIAAFIAVAYLMERVG
jgi:hypothetical protein